MVAQSNRSGIVYVSLAIFTKNGLVLFIGKCDAYVTQAILGQEEQDRR
jgi:hypothetical protein